MYFAFRLFGVFLTLSLLSILVQPTEAFITTVTVENINSAMAEIAIECKKLSMTLDTCRDFAQEIHPEFASNELGHFFDVGFNLIYRSAIALN
jgi:hypothetical protein